MKWTPLQYVTFYVLCVCIVLMMGIECEWSLGKGADFQSGKVSQTWHYQAKGAAWCKVLVKLV